MNKLNVIAAAFAGLLVSSQGLQSAIVVTTSTSGSLAGGEAPPAISNTDLGQTAYLSSSSTSTDAMGTRHGEMFNGTAGTTATGTGSTDAVRIDVGDSVTLNLDVSVNTLGYDITQIDTLFGWNELGAGRSSQGYSIDLGFVGGGSATLVNAQYWEPNSNPDFWTFVSFSNSGGGALFSDTVNLNGSGAIADTSVLATGVQSITWNYTNGQSPAIAREFDVYGFATVPETSTFALLAGSLALGAVMTRRRRS